MLIILQTTSEAATLESESLPQSPSWIPILDESCPASPVSHIRQVIPAYKSLSYPKSLNLYTYNAPSAKKNLTLTLSVVIFTL